MCGIIGIVANSPVNQALYDGLTVLQHRGQDAAGIMTSDGERLFLRKANGLVRDVFHTRHMLRLRGNMGIGHVRYPTAGCFSTAEAQPFYVNSPFGIALAHNGNLTNAEDLKRDLFVEDRRHLNTESDSEILLNVFAHELQRSTNLNLEAEDVFIAVSGVHRRCRGAYAVVAVVPGRGLIAFRDPYGIRPLVLGERQSEAGTEYMVASESVAIDALGYELVRDLAPGEAIFINHRGELFSRVCTEHPRLSPCIFEYVYFARPDSVMNGVSIYQSRMRMGQYLAEKILRHYPDHDIDVVLPIPDTSRTSALQLSYTLGVKYSEGFIKNRYIGRTFIMPGQKQRKKSVRQKLNPIDTEFAGLNVLLVDDSIVRGTTSQQIIQMARESGARKVYFASAAPPVRHPNVYGIDMPSASELIGFGRDDKAIAREIGADWLIYQDLEDLVRAVQESSDELTEFDTSVFNGDYVTGDINEAYLQQLEKMRSDKARKKLDTDEDIMELHNNA
ncbi:MAG: amidophosphoribosyltransferase [Gammaproteobacteria bacterium]